MAAAVSTASAGAAARSGGKMGLGSYRRAVGRLLRMARMRLRRAGDVDVIVLGRYGRRYNHALDSGAPVWRLLPEVHRVRQRARWLTAERLQGTNRPLIVLPIGERHMRARPEGGHALIPDRALLDSLGDKNRARALLLAHGFAAYLPDRYHWPDKVRFPLVLKRPDLSAGHGVSIVPDAGTLALRLAEPHWIGHALLLEEYVGALEEFVLHAVADRGKLVWHCAYCYRFVEEGRVKGRDAPAALTPTEVPDAVLGVFAELLNKLCYTGPVNIDYRFRPDGRLLIHEINPRLGSSLMLRENVRDLADCLRVLIITARTRGDGASDQR